MSFAQSCFQNNSHGSLCSEKCRHHCGLLTESGNQHCLIKPFSTTITPCAAMPKSTDEAPHGRSGHVSANKIKTSFSVCHTQSTQGHNKDNLSSSYSTNACALSHVPTSSAIHFLSTVQPTACKELMSSKDELATTPCTNVKRRKKRGKKRSFRDLLKDVKSSNTTTSPPLPSSPPKATGAFAKLERI